MARKEIPIRFLGFMDKNGVMHPPDKPPQEVVERICQAIIKNIPGTNKAISQQRGVACVVADRYSIG